MRSYPHLKGILFDLPDIIAIVDVDEAIQPVAGNFFESVQAMPEHAKLLLVEGIIPPGNEPSQVNIDMIMLLLGGGRERTEEEYRSLLRSSGFELTQVISTPSMLSIIEAVKL